jgi:chaperone modulatory protein CbpM
MMTKSKILTGVILDENIELSINELCRSCSVQHEMIVALVEEGVLTPVNTDETGYRFPGASVRLVIKAVRLQRDLDLNYPGIALALELMDEIERLRERLREFE